MHILIVIALLALSNLIMTFAWYWHIKPAAIVADYPDQLGHCPVGILPRRPRQPFRRAMGHQTLPAQNHAGSGNALRIRPVCRAVFKRKNHTELFTELCLRFGCRVFRV